MKVNHSLIALLNNVPDAIIAMTPAGTVLGWNQDAIEELGYSSEAQGWLIYDLVVPADRISEGQEDLHRKLVLTASRKPGQLGMYWLVLNELPPPEI